MRKVGGSKEYNWLIPLFGGIIALIGFVTPAASISNFISTLNIWMWGLFSIKEFDYYTLNYYTATQFTINPIEIIISLISSLIVLIGIISLIAKANSYRKNQSLEGKWISPSILLIIGSLIWIVGMEIYSQIDIGLSFWTFISPGFGVIGPFFGAIITLIGYAVIRSKPKQPREVITPQVGQEIHPYKIQQQPSSLHPQESPIVKQAIKYCIRCGEKNLKESLYCIECGNKFPE